MILCFLVYKLSQFKLKKKIETINNQDIKSVVTDVVIQSNNTNNDEVIPMIEEQENINKSKENQELHIKFLHAKEDSISNSEYCSISSFLHSPSLNDFDNNNNNNNNNNNHTQLESNLLKVVDVEGQENI